MKLTQILRILLGIAGLAIGLYLIIWCILNPEDASLYPFISIFSIIAGALIIISTLREKDNNDRCDTDKKQTLEEFIISVGENLEETESAPEEKTLANGIDVNNLPYKSKTIAILLCIFFGLLGIHRIYLGHTQSGIAMMIFTLCFGWTILVPIILCVLCLIDIISIANGDLKDSYNRPLV